MKIVIANGAGPGYIGSVVTNSVLQNGYKVGIVGVLRFKENIPL